MCLLQVAAYPIDLSPLLPSFAGITVNKYLLELRCLDELPGFVMESVLVQFQSL